MSEARQFATVLMPSGRVVSAMIVSNRPGEMLLVTWGGLKPFSAQPLTHEAIAWLEQNPGLTEPPAHMLAYS